MKTIHKKDNTNKSSPAKPTKRDLIDHPKAHALLHSSRSPVDRQFISDIIQQKQSRSKANSNQKMFVSSISLCLSLILVIWAFEIEFADNKPVIEANELANQFEDLMEIPQTQQIQKPPAIIQAPTIVEVDDEEIIEEIEVNLDIEMTEDTRIEEVVVSEGMEPMPEEKTDEIFTIVEQQPSPVGGIKAFYDYVGKNMKYPGQARRMGIEGRVFVEFIVEKDGSLTDLKVAKGIGGGCDQEAIRVIASAPKWNPGKQRGNPVRVRMVMPIMFKLMN